MRLWMINIGEQIPADPGMPRLLRTGILAQHLTDRGHDVTWWNATVNHPQKIQRAHETTITDPPEGYRLILLHGRLYKRNISIGRIVSQIENAREFRKAAPQQPRPDAILCGYPSIELARAATEFALQNNIPIAIDFRDMWPDVFEEYVPSALKWTADILFARWRRDLAFLVDNATAITGVTEGFIEWALGQTGRRRSHLDRPFHLAINPQRPADAEMVKAERFWDEKGVTRNSAELIGCYPGTLSRRLDLKTLVGGLIGLEGHEKQKIKFIICGRGDLQQELQDMARGESHIMFAGWRDASQIHALLKRCDFGTIPYRSTRDFVVHYPNKLGEYLSAGLPVLTGLAGSTRELLSEKGLGYFYQEGDREDLTRTLRRMLSDRQSLAEMKPRAVTAFRDLFDGTRIYPEFCDYLEALARTGDLSNGEKASVS